jgi:hypothetical protein
MGIQTIFAERRYDDPKAHRVYRLRDEYRKVYENVGRPLIFSPREGDDSADARGATDGFAHLESRSTPRIERGGRMSGRADL